MQRKTKRGLQTLPATTGTVPSRVVSKEFYLKVMLGKANINILFEAKQVFLQKALCLYVYVDLGHGNIPCSMQGYTMLNYRR